jgi:hypothetical protein
MSKGQLLVQPGDGARDDPRADPDGRVDAAGVSRRNHVREWCAVL